MPFLQLLCWMHRKFRQNSNEALKALVIGHSGSGISGQSSFDDQQYYSKSNYGARPFKQAQKDNHLRKSFTGLEAVRAEEEDYEEESSAAISELFHGFLAIGTLGSDQIVTDPATPTFAISVDNITEKETEVTENELKLINDELEKVLGAEAPDDGFNDSSGRNSHVSNGRSSHGSIITLSGKPEDGNGTPVCPLQGYLFGSAIELSETTTTVAKKEHRTSLGELFQRSKITEESGGGKGDREEKRSEKEADKSAMNLMKKKLKKKMLHASSRSSAAGPGGGGPVDSAPTETKLHKILHMFHRKVHPETSTAAQKSSGKVQKNEYKKKTIYDGTGNYGRQIPPDEDITLCPQRALFLKQKIRRYRSQSNPPQFTFGSIDSIGNREQWIKTDADCKTFIY
ncbi:regulator of nonsense transcript protein [Trema orientale]|uniref:Regulator of nonsense transcript protein n=1 Tax=Trema orientale TaxID=63057 RepID=A0A2P5C1R3_TREOI|nr:regulator of nonsense transcript protein [Trema orientale]